MIAVEIAAKLAADGHGVEGTDLFVDTQPDDPADCVTVMDSSAPQPDEASTLAIDHAGFQVLTRAATLDAAQTKAHDVHRELVGFSGLLGATRCTYIATVTFPYSIGRDNKKRAEVSAHYFARVESTGDAHRV